VIAANISAVDGTCPKDYLKHIIQPTVQMRNEGIQNRVCCCESELFPMAFKLP
jgi:hypothetical protein